METFLLILSIAVVLIGLAGTLLPWLPGIPLIFVGYVVWGFASGWRDYGVNIIVILGVVTVVVLLLDYVAGVIGAKKYGASRWGTWGAIIGGIIGLIFFNILGLILGPLAGAVAGELFSGRTQRDAWRAGWGAFVGIMAGGLIRITVAVIMAVLFFYYLI